MKKLLLNIKLLTLNSNRGVVALITTIIIGLLLVVITTGAVALMIGELRQASDFDQSVKAYFAAEAGAEDAIAEIRRRLKAGQSLSTIVGTASGCPAFSPLEADLGSSLAYTCQLVTTAANSVSGQLAPEETTQIDLAGIGTFDRIKVSWNRVGTDNPAADWQEPLPGGFPGSGDAEAWAARNPAVLETSVINYPKQASFNASEIEIATAVLKPNEAPPSHPNNLFNLSSISSPERILCNESAGPGQHNCSADINAFSASDNYVLRLHSRYSRASYLIEAFSGNNIVPIPNAQLTIDVTGRAGNDIFRRVLIKIPISDQPLINFVILANDSICKVFEVTGSPAVANSETGCVN